MRIVITQHAYEKGRERLGLKPNAFEKVVACAFCYGVEPQETKGELKKYIKHLFEEHNNTDARIYGENIYIFSGNRLVTVYRLHTNLIKYLKV